jgi:type VI secretion system protein ImpM
LEKLAPPGWHGKLPTLGDFASRRIDPDFLAAWDHWLATGMLALREQQGAAWLDAYLTSPSWRFLLMPGVLAGDPGTHVWAGVLMPSVDRMGRYFPFTLVRALDERAVAVRQMPALWAWLARLDDLAAQALQDDWGIERLEEELVPMAGPDLAAPTVRAVTAPPAMPGTLTKAADADPVECIGQEAQALWSTHARGMAYWHACAEQQPPRLLHSHGLPAASSMGGLFGGSLP